MSGLRLILVGLLVVSTALFAVGAFAERSQADERGEPASVRAHESGESPGELGGEHHEGEAEAAGDRVEAPHADESERLLGVETESTPLIILAVIAGLALAALAATPVGRGPLALLAIALLALAFAVLDVREVAHQLDESHTGVAIVAIAVAVLHLASAAIAGLLAARARPADVGTPAGPGTMPA